MGQNQFIVRTLNTVYPQDFNAISIINAKKNNYLNKLTVTNIKKFASENSKLPVVDFSYIVNGTKRSVRCVQIKNFILVIQRV